MLMILRWFKTRPSSWYVLQFVGIKQWLITVVMLRLISKIDKYCTKLFIQILFTNQHINDGKTSKRKRNGISAKTKRNNNNRKKSTVKLIIRKLQVTRKKHNKILKKILKLRYKTKHSNTASTYCNSLTMVKTKIDQKFWLGWEGIERWIRNTLTAIVRTKVWANAPNLE